MGAQVAHAPAPLHGPHAPATTTNTTFCFPSARGHTRSRSPAPEHYTTQDLASARGYIREERKYVSGGISPRAAEAIKNGQSLVTAWAEKREPYQPHTPYDEYDETPGETTETIELWVMFEGDLRPTRLTSNETEYTWRSTPPDSRLTRGEVTVHADSAHIEPDSTRPWL